MRSKINKLLLCFFVFSLFFSIKSSAQNITGIWRGYFITDFADQYKFELQIEQSKNNRISGVSYSYLTTVFYGKATLTGFFNKANSSALIQEIKTVELRMSGGSTACIMKCNFTYSKSGNEEFLEGTYTSMYEKTNKESNIERGGNCGGGKIFLRKVPTSDFYVEPFLREKPTVKKPATPPAKTTTAITKKPATTTAKKPATTTTKKPVAATKPKTPVKPPVNKTIAIKPKADTTKKIVQAPVISPEIKKVPERPVFKAPQVTRQRQNELLKTLEVNSTTVNIKLYDNGEVDDDTISVYLDNKLILANKRLSAAPISFSVNMNDDGEEHVLVMVAENLGRMPPNTSLMIVNDGEKRYEVRITSTEQKNAMVRFRYVKR